MFHAHSCVEKTEPLVSYNIELYQYLGESRINLYADNTAPYVIKDTDIDLALTLRKELIYNH